MPRSTDRTAQTGILTPGQQTVAAWEMTPCGEPADLADMIDDCVMAEQMKFERALYDTCGSHNMVKRTMAKAGYASLLFPETKITK